MNPWIHAKNSAKRYGGIPEDFLEVHLFMDSAKEHLGTIVHRIVLHNTFGIALAEKLFGDIVQTGTGKFVRQPFITNSDGKKVFIRDIAQDHVLEDMHGVIPFMSDLFEDITVELFGHKLGLFGPLIKKVKRDFANKEGEKE